MINLLPPTIRQEYRYAHRNVSLRKWVFVFLIALIGLGALTSYGLISIKQSAEAAKKQLASTEQQLSGQDFDGVKKQSEDITNSFKLVLQVLSKEVLFSKLLTHIATIVPTNVVLTGLTINPSQTGIDISAMATDYNAATQTQVNLSDPKNNIFSKADIVSIGCGANENADPRYPCTVTIRALFANKNSYQLIDTSTKEKAK